MTYISKDFNINIPDFSKQLQEAVHQSLNASIELLHKNINNNYDDIKNRIKMLSDTARDLINNFDPTKNIRETMSIFNDLLHQITPTLEFMYNEYPEYKNAEISSTDNFLKAFDTLKSAEVYCNENNVFIANEISFNFSKAKDNKITIETVLAFLTLLVTIFLGIWDHLDKNNDNDIINHSEIIMINNNETEEILFNLAETIYVELIDTTNIINELNRQSIERSDLMNSKMSKEEIFALAKEKGIKLSFLNELIGGYRGKLTDWKNGKTTLTDNEINIIIDYLLENRSNIITVTDDDIKFALFNGTEGITDEMYDEVKQFAEMVKMRENAKRNEKNEIK